MNLDKIKSHQSTILGMEHLKKYAVCIPLIKTEDGYEIWGLTAMIMKSFVDILEK